MHLPGCSSFVAVPLKCVSGNVRQKATDNKGRNEALVKRLQKKILRACTPEMARELQPRNMPAFGLRRQCGIVHPAGSNVIGNSEIVGVIERMKQEPKNYKVRFAAKDPNAKDLEDGVRELRENINEKYFKGKSILQPKNITGDNTMLPPPFQITEQSKSFSKAIVYPEVEKTKPPLEEVSRSKKFSTLTIDDGMFNHRGLLNSYEAKRGYSSKYTSADEGLDQITYDTLTEWAEKSKSDVPRRIDEMYARMYHENEQQVEIQEDSDKPDGITSNKLVKFVPKTPVKAVQVEWDDRTPSGVQADSFLYDLDVTKPCKKT